MIRKSTREISATWRSQVARFACLLRGLSMFRRSAGGAPAKDGLPKQILWASLARSLSMFVGNCLCPAAGFFVESQERRAE
jgi:hypothetical protein